MNFNDNVDLTDPILSRFDILTVIRDEVKQDDDHSLASFVINSHIKSHPEFKMKDPTIEGNDDINIQIMKHLNELLLDESKLQ